MLSDFGTIIAFHFSMDERVAIPQWMGRVSPVFDTATKLLIVDFAGGEYRTRETIQLGASGHSRRVAIIGGRGIQTILCGAISRNLQYRLNRIGIRVFAFLSGDISALLSAYAEGETALSEFMLPGCQRRRRRGRRFHQGGMQQEFTHNSFGEEK